jgi:hypothetical protein
MTRRAKAMPQSLEERVAYLEGKVEVQARGFGDLIGRMDGLSTRIDALSSRIDAMSDRFDEKMSRQFTWIVGIQMATMLAIIAALLRN